jgi:hypothetical protein
MPGLKPARPWMGGQAMRRRLRTLGDHPAVMSSTPAPSDPAEELAELQDRLYDLVVTSVTQTHRLDALRRLRRDAQEAAALAEDLADAVLRSDSETPRG